MQKRRTSLETNHNLVYSQKLMKTNGKYCDLKEHKKSKQLENYFEN